MHYTEILVARHGETDWNNSGKWQGDSDIPLNAKGMEQARELAGRLLKEDIRYIYSSDLSRARTTAEIVRKIISSYGVYEEKGLRERSLGKFEGWSAEQVARYMGIPEEEAYRLETDELMIDTFPTVERWADFVNRVWESLNDIADKHTGSKCLVVAHGGVLRAITMKLGNGEGTRLNFENTEFVRLSFDGERISLIGE